MKTKKNKLIRRSKTTIKNNYSKSKTFKNPNTVDVKSATIEHSETSYKLSRSIRQAKRVSQVGSGKIYNSP